MADRARQSRRLFFSLWPTDECRAQMETATSPVALRSGGRLVPSRNFHVTLLFLGEVPVSRIGAIQQLAAAIADVPPFTLTFDRIESWAGANVLCLAASEVPPAVIELTDKLRYCLRGEQLRLNEREFRPHVTLVRDLPALLPAEPIEPLRWNVNEFALVDSRRGGDPQYSIIGRWPLNRSADTGG